jgi:hypothetical protein
MISNSDKFIFISFVTGSGGHFIGRCFSSATNAVWWDHPKNGANPWDWNKFTTNEGLAVSNAHFARLFKDDHHYLTNYRLDDFSVDDNPPEEIVKSYNSRWLKNKTKDRFLPYPSHFSPYVLKKQFPNSKIVLIDSTASINKVVARFIDICGPYRALMPGNSADIRAQELWSNTYNQNTLRDWEQYWYRQTREQWIEHKAREIIADNQNKMKESAVCDAVIPYHSIRDLDVIKDLMTRLDLNINEQRLQRVCDSFNTQMLVDQAISNIQKH